HTVDKKFAFFTKALLPDWRMMSIVKTSFKNGKWSSPLLADFSGQYLDFDPSITGDQSKLLFISNRPCKHIKNRGDYSIWYIDAPFDKNNEPKLLEGDFYTQINKPLYPSMASNGNLYFCAPDT